MCQKASLRVSNAPICLPCAMILKAVNQILSVAQSNLWIAITYEHSLKLTFILETQYSATNILSKEVSKCSEAELNVICNNLSRMGEVHSL